jgi:hypothetical protein
MLLLEEQYHPHPLSYNPATSTTLLFIRTTHPYTHTE